MLPLENIYFSIFDVQHSSIPGLIPYLSTLEVRGTKLALLEVEVGVTDYFAAGLSASRACSSES